MSEPTREEVIAERAAASSRDFVEHGPRLWAGRQSYVLARGDGKTLWGGVGAMGMGVMWTDARDSDAADPTYADAPYNPDQLDNFGANGRATLVLAQGDGMVLVRNWLGRGETLWVDAYPSAPRRGEAEAPYEPDRLDDQGRAGRRT